MAESLPQDRVATVVRQVTGTVEDHAVINEFLKEYSTALEQEQRFLNDQKKLASGQVNQLLAQARTYAMAAQQNPRLAKNCMGQANQLAAQANKLALSATLQLEQHNNKVFGELIARFDKDPRHQQDAGWQTLKPHVQSIYATQAQQVRQYEKAANQGKMGIGNWLGAALGALVGFFLTGGGPTGLLVGAGAAYVCGKGGGWVQDLVADWMTPSAPSPAPVGIVMAPSQQTTAAMAPASLPSGITDVSRADPVVPHQTPIIQVRNNSNGRPVAQRSVRT